MQADGHHLESTTTKGIPMGSQRSSNASTHAIGRRTVLGASGAGAVAAALAACTGGGQSAQESGGGGGGGDGTLQWWDQFRPLTETFEQDLFGPFMEENPEITVERRQLAAADLGQALQIASRSDQMPDVHSLAGLDSSPAALVSDDWFQPIGAYADFESSEIADQLYDGIQRFDDELYTVPMFSGRWHENVPWFNTAMMEKAGIDPEGEGPATWDELRDVTRRVMDGADTEGIFVPGQDPAYLNQLVTRLAQTAGAPGTIDWATGEYVQDSQPFLDVFELLQSLLQDGLIHPSSPSMNPRDARARWAAGEGAIYPWGAWFIGGLSVEEPEAVERGISCWHLPGPEAERNPIYSGPSGGTFWVSADAREPEAAAQLLHRLTTRDFQMALASAMDQPPALLDVIEEADVHPAYARCVSFFQDDVLISPVPESGTPGAWRVAAEMRDVRPDVGDLLQSMLAGESVDVSGELTRFTDELSKERERAIEAVQEETDVDLGAWVFENWDPTRDYERTDYDAR